MLSKDALFQHIRDWVSHFGIRLLVWIIRRKRGYYADWLR
jgi:hypothetical protein